MQIFGNRNLLSVIRESLYFPISPSKSIPFGSNKFCVLQLLYRHKFEIKFTFIVTSLEFGLFKETFTVDRVFVNKKKNISKSI